VGTAKRLARECGDGGYRLTDKWDFASGCRQARWMGAHGHVLEADGTLRLNRFGRPTVRTLLFPASEATLLDTWRTIGLRGTASDSYSVNELFVSEAFSSTREDPALRRERGPLYAFTMQGLYAVGVAAVAFGIARAMLSELIALASRKAPRGLARLADNAVVHADVVRAEARLGSARAYLIETLSTIYAHADDVAPIEVADRARVRLACTNAIQAAAEVVDFAYKAAGVDAIFPGSPASRSATTTSAPARASKIAAARPLPIPSPAAPPPLTIATLPARPASSSRSFVRASASRPSTVSPAQNAPETGTSAQFIKARRVDVGLGQKSGNGWTGGAPASRIG
jgi:alkylation response protein AidB-like acyl-CoA dehydrogenase